MPGYNLSGAPDKKWGAHTTGGYENAMEQIATKFNPDGTAHPTGSWFKIADSKNRGAKGIPHRTAGHLFRLQVI